jgi:hypothetical protein
MSAHASSDPRVEGIHTWAEAARRYYAVGDPFACYIAAWIALTIKAIDFDAHHSRLQRGQQPQDSVLVEKLFAGEHDIVGEVLACHHDETDWLASRRGRTQGTPLLDATLRSEHYEAVRSLASWWSAGEAGHHGAAEATAFALVLNRVRNNLFHGQKIYVAASEDAQLLKHLNPLMLGLLDRWAPV